LETARTQEEVVDAIRAWNSELPESPAMQERLGTFQHFYYAPDLDLIAPSKFIGYLGLTSRRYIQHARSDLWGGRTERVLRRWFVALPEGTPEERYVRSRVRALLSRFGKWPRSRSTMHAPRGWGLSQAVLATPPKAKGVGTASTPRSTVREAAIPLKRTITASIHRSEGFFVAECVEIPVVTQGENLDATLRNLQEAVALHLDGEDPTVFGLVAAPSVIVTMELEPALA
jgi:predicted RNase H-like HicB family nuclease